MAGDVRISQLDGSLPNVALMRLAHWHRSRGDAVHFFRGKDAVKRKVWEPVYERVYASAIFQFSAPLVDEFRWQWPDAIIGGTGTTYPVTVEQVTGEAVTGLDYSIDPTFKPSIGFTQRGCRLRCKFCVVPQKEGRPAQAQTIAKIWRGKGHPKHIHLLDNDFFAIDGWWQERIAEIRAGGFKVSFTQGINVRKVTDEVAAALAGVEYRDNTFQRRRLYTAWDNLGDERVFFDGVDTLERAGVPPAHLMAFMLVGFDPKETWERIFHRVDRMIARGILPYPMIYGDKRRPPAQRTDGSLSARLATKTLGDFQRWVVTGLYRSIPFHLYDVNTRKPRAAA